MAIKNVLILGAGTMGLQIGALCAASGFGVTVYDPVEKALDAAEKRAATLVSRMAGANRIPADEEGGCLERIRFTGDPEQAGQDADIISESVPEDPQVKARVFAQFNEICPPHCIFTTNTSTLVPSMIADATGRPGLFAALHFHDCMLTNVVDIMPHPETRPSTLDGIRQFCSAIGQFPIELQKEQHGYVFNTMLSELLGAALSLASKEVAAVPDIDRAWMGIMKTLVGPFGIMDAIGLETVYKVTDFWAQKKGDRQGMKNAAFLKAYVDKNQLGIKTQKGFYTYPDPEFASPGFMAGIH